MLSLLRRAIAEPLTQFLLIGTLLFGISRMVSRPYTDAKRIVLTQAFVDGLRADAERRNGHPLNPEELKGVLDRYIDEEVLYRQAVALGLDRGDVIVRRRLIEKMEFLTEDSTPDAEPSDADLNRWLDAHRAQFTEPDRVSFEHVFFDPGRHPNGGDPREGDAFPAGQSWKLRSESEIAATFGPKFAAEVMALPVGDSWSPLVRSSFGLHRVRVTEHLAGKPATLDAVRERVRKAWQADHRAQQSADGLAKLRASYIIEVPANATMTAERRSR